MYYAIKTPNPAVFKTIADISDFNWVFFILNRIVSDLKLAIFDDLWAI